MLRASDSDNIKVQKISVLFNLLKMTEQKLLDNLLALMFSVITIND